MQIDWITVGAQIVNFLVLVWLLQRFLYGPIIRAMERREQRIRDRLHEAERSKNEAEDEARTYREKQEELERGRDRLLGDAHQAAEEERKSLERDARQHVETRKREWLKQLDMQRDAFLDDLRRRAAEQFYALARRALGDLADADLEERIALRFAAQVEALDKDVIENIAQACGRAGGRVKVASHFVLSADAKRQITRVLHQRIGENIEVDYEACKDVACGIELKAGGQTVSWTLDSYLDGFEKAVGERFSDVAASANGRADT